MSQNDHVVVSPKSGKLDFPGCAVLHDVATLWSNRDEAL